MLKNYFKVAIRNLIKHKTYSFIHIVGLTVGITCLVLITNYVRYELSYDKFNKNADRIFRITGHDWVQTQVPLSSTFRNFFPEITNTVRIRKVDKILLGNDQKKFYEEGVIFSDPSIFDVFTYPLLKGNPFTALNDPYSVVLTEDAARKYFGEQNPIGKKLSYDERIDYQITGVLKNIPNNSHLKFDFVFSLGSAQAVFGKDFFDNGMNTVVYNYFMLRTKSDFRKVQSRLDDFTRSYLGEEMYKFNKANKSKWRIEYHIQPLTSIHLHSNLGGEIEPNGNIDSVFIFSIIAILILLIACINYINLSTARYMNRIKEVGIRKVIGANRSNIIYQFIGESILFSFIAILLSYCLIELFSPWLSSALGKKDILANTGSEFLFLLIGVTLFTGLVSGAYPAFFLSRFHPVHILSKKILRTNKRLNFGNVLVSFQFVVSIILIFATLVVNNQLLYIHNKNLGFSKEQIIVVPLQGKPVGIQSETLKNEILHQSEIVNASLSSIIPGGVKWVRSFNWEGQKDKDENTMCFIISDYDFLKTYKVQVVEGRYLSQSYSTDAEQGFLINQAALKKLGWKSALGKKIGSFGKQGSVIGLMKDFNFKSLHERIEPLAIYIGSQNDYGYLSLRIKTENVAGVFNSIETKWKTLLSDKPFEYFFLDEYWGKLYRKEQNMKNLFSGFSGLAIFISCLGLFGLVSFTTEVRKKEIGIRKVMGAATYQIIGKILMEMMILIIISILFAVPIAYYAMDKWLQDFAYRIEISWWMFVLSGGIALLIALATVSFQSIKAAIANPVEALRYE